MVYDIEITDSDENLSVHCYTNCDNDAPEHIRDCRGIIKDKNDNIVVKTFGYSPEYTVQDFDKIKELFPDLTRCLLFESQEGCLIRVYKYNDKWYVSTHKKIDAYRSKWSSNHSFGEMFEESLYNEYQSNTKLQQILGVGLTSSTDVFQNLTKFLRDDRTYMFLLRNTAENRIVCDPPAQPTLYYSGSFNKDGTDLQIDDLTITIPKRLEFQTIEEMLDYVDTIDYKKHQGVVVFCGNKSYKILNSNYLKYFNTRGNEPNIRFRYLQIRNDQEMKKNIIELYPEYITDFHKYENLLLGAIKMIHQCYFARFIRKEYSVVPPELFYIVRECHTWHLSDRDNNKVNMEVVRQTLNRQNASVLLRIIKRMESL